VSELPSVSAHIRKSYAACPQRASQTREFVEPGCVAVRAPLQAIEGTAHLRLLASITAASDWFWLVYTLYLPGT
jgi:hypothetical protein